MGRQIELGKWVSLLTPFRRPVVVEKRLLPDMAGEKGQAEMIIFSNGTSEIKDPGASPERLRGRDPSRPSREGKKAA